MRRRYGFGATIRQLLIDFFCVLALFWIAAFALGDVRMRAHAVPYPPLDIAKLESQTALPWPQATASELAHARREVGAAHTQALVLLSVGVAMLAALNLAFLRHLRRVYASPRRGVWRRD